MCQHDFRAVGALKVRRSVIVLHVRKVRLYVVWP